MDLKQLLVAVVALLSLLSSACTSDGIGPADAAPQDFLATAEVTPNQPPADMVADSSPTNDTGPAGDTWVPADLDAVQDTGAGRLAEISNDLPHDESSGELPLDISEPHDDQGAPFQIGPGGLFQRSVQVDGVNRIYQLYVPDSAVAAMASGPVPLLVALHGAGDNGENFIVATGLTGTADANAFVLVGPEGYNAGWFVQKQEGWTGSDGNETSLQNDAELVLTIMDELALEYLVDHARIYAVGHSRGAGCIALFAVLSGGMNIASGAWQTPFAAYGINAGYDAAGGQLDFGLASPKRPLWIIHGTADNVVPFSYGKALADSLSNSGWDTTFTPINNAGHTWLWRPQYGQSNQLLWDFLASHSAP